MINNWPSTLFCDLERIIKKPIFADFSIKKRKSSQKGKFSKKKNLKYPKKSAKKGEIGRKSVFCFLN